MAEAHVREGRLVLALAVAPVVDDARLRVSHKVGDELEVGPRLFGPGAREGPLLLMILEARLGGGTRVAPGSRSLQLFFRAFLERSEKLRHQGEQDPRSSSRPRDER